MTPATIDEYIAGSAPGARERISYRTPCFSLERDLVYFATFRNHVGFPYD